MRCALRIGVDRGRLGGDLCRCAVGIGGGRVVSDALCRCDWGERVVWVALCRCDWRARRRVGSAAPLGLAGRASCGWRCAVV